MQLLKCDICGKEGLKDIAGLETHKRMMHKGQVEQKALFWIRVPESEKKEWEERAKKANMDLTKFLRHVMSTGDREEFIKTSIKADYENKLIKLEDENKKLKEIQDGLLREITKTGKLRKSVIKPLFEIEDFYDTDRLYEEGLISSIENDILDKEWNKLNFKQKTEAHKIMNKGNSLVDAIKQVSHHTSAEFKEWFK